MKLVFADTFFWIALTDDRDEAHERALKVSREASLATLCTTEEVLTEYLNYFAEGGWMARENAVLNVARTLQSSRIRVLAQSRFSFEQGFALYRSRLDKGYSLTDCISMAAMRAEGIAEVLTNDAHFEQEGFRALFRKRR